MKRFILMVILLCWHVMCVAAIATQVNRTSVQVGEMFRVMFTLDEPHRRETPDLSPLQQDFTIVGTERSVAYSVVNGQSHSVNQWVLSLTAKRTGKLVIPSIQIGQQQTMATSIDVIATAPMTEEAPDDSAPQPDVMLKTDLSANTAFVNQQLTYTVKLYNSQRLLDAEYIPPHVEDALLIPLGNGVRSQTIMNGQGYTVEEQQYAIFPQKSGELHIVAPTFNAVVVDSMPRRINVHAKAKRVTVKPIPSTYSGKYWFPAKQVSLTEVYDDLSVTLDQGSTLVRTITLQAAGIPAELLPPLTFPSSEEYNAYPEKPALRNTSNQHVVVGRMDIKVTYLLNKSGLVTLPALQVRWFNTDKGHEDVVSLPARALDIKALAGRSSKKATPHSANIKKKVQASSAESFLSTLAFREMGTWFALILGLLGVIFLVGWGGRSFFLKGHPLRQALQKLRHACVNNHPLEAQNALLQWARVQWPEARVLNLYQLAKLTRDTPLKKQLSLLSQALYSQESHVSWQGRALWRSVMAFRQARPAKTRKGNGLPPINPA